MTESTLFIPLANHYVKPTTFFLCEDKVALTLVITTNSKEVYLNYFKLIIQV